MKLSMFTMAMMLVSNMAFANSDDHNNSQNDHAEQEVTESAELDFENLPEPSNKILVEVKKECQGFALDEEVPVETLDQYLLECVNEELDSMGYKKVKRFEPPKLAKTPN